MALLTKDPNQPTKTTPANGRAPLFDGVSERDLAPLYTASTVRKLRKDESLLTDIREDAIYIVTEGGIRLASESETMRRSAIFGKGECLGPVLVVNWTQFALTAAEPTVLLEITPRSLSQLSDKLQAAIFGRAARWNSQLAVELIGEAVNLRAANAVLSSQAKSLAERTGEALEHGVLKDFINSVPRLPVHATELAGKLASEATPIHEIVDSLKNDVSVASMVLKTVNSARFGLRGKIETLYHACMLLGYNNMYQLVIRESIKTVMPSTPETERLHEHSSLLAALCYEVASLTRQGNPQVASTIGLLHDIGHSLMTLFKAKRPDLAGLCSLVNTTQVGGQLLKQWQMPDRIQQVIEYQHYPYYATPRQLPPELWADVTVLYVAHLCESLLQGRKLDKHETIYINDYLPLLGIVNEDIHQFMKERMIPALVKDRKRLSPELREYIPEA